MKFSSHETDIAILAEMGSRLQQARLALGLSQLELANRAGVAKRTVERIESGDSGSLENFIRLLRVLESIPRLEALLPEAMTSPIEQLKQRGKKRQRASASRKQQRTQHPANKWIWGDER